MAVWQRGRDECDLVADRAAKDRSGAEVHAVCGDGALRAARLARVRRAGHLRAEQFLKQTTQPAPGRFDLAGFLLAGAGLGLLMYGVSEGPNKGWSDPSVLAGATVRI